MPKNISRRGFLKGSAAAVAGVAAAPLVLPQAAQAATGEELCTLLDLSKCIGCEACVEACREQWQATVPDPVKDLPKPFPKRVPIEDWSKRKDVQDRLTPYNFLYVEMLDVDYKGQSQELFIPRRCMHCVNPPCTNLCPFGAGRIEKNGIVHIDKDICLGGSKCKKVCPWHIPQRQSGVGLYLDILPAYAGNGVMFKCHRCLPLVKQGKTPRCIEVCPESVQSIGPRQQMLEKGIALAKQKAAADGGQNWRDYIYGLKENGGTGTLYVSHIPFPVVAKAVDGYHQELAAEQGGKKRGNLGRPPMHSVANSMASEENLMLALAVAPVAGLAAGAAKLFNKVKKHLPGDDQDGGKGGQA